MGAWGYGSFDNDDAADWVWELEHAGDYEVVRPVLEAVAERDDHLEAPTCCEAIAAAEVVAAGRGRPLAKLPEDATRWLEGRAAPDDAFVQLARRAVAAILAKSELREVWQESSGLDAWRERMDDLAARLL